MKKYAKIVVKGKVQGVSYRDFVQKEAQKLQLEGTVQNAADGTVVINALGTNDNIESLIDLLYQGSAHSAVDEVTEEPLSQFRDFRGVFRIIH